MQERMRTHRLTKDQIRELLDTAPVGHLATIDPDGRPYVVPVHFVHLEGRIYIHGLLRGQKLDNIARDPKVGFETVGDFALVHGQSARETNTTYKSVVIRGLASVVEDDDVLTRALDAIVAKYAPRHVGGEYLDKGLAITAVIAVEILRITGKYY
jgi:nitroimidazol reductase NimA-like FMN-containing flavoprotein (pyridoxamine 5'-phosphate oxidase superfamily)